LPNQTKVDSSDLTAFYKYNWVLYVTVVLSSTSVPFSESQLFHELFLLHLRSV